MASPLPFTIQVALSHSMLLKLLHFKNILHYNNNALLTSLNEAMQDRTEKRLITQ